MASRGEPDTETHAEPRRRDVRSMSPEAVLERLRSASRGGWNNARDAYATSGAARRAAIAADVDALIKNAAGAYEDPRGMLSHYARAAHVMVECGACDAPRPRGAPARSGDLLDAIVENMASLLLNRGWTAGALRWDPLTDGAYLAAVAQRR